MPNDPSQSTLKQSSTVLLSEKKSTYRPPHRRSENRSSASITPAPTPVATSTPHRFDKTDSWDHLAEPRDASPGAWGQKTTYSNYGRRYERAPAMSPISRFHTKPLPRNPETERRLFETGKMSTGINFSKYSDIPVEMTGHNIPDPMTSFQESDIDEIVKLNIQLAHYSQATPVQRYSFSAVQHTRDLMACAQTGSGKTAAFLIPIISRLLQQGPPVHPSSIRARAIPLAIIIAPTRELASQIYDEALKFSYRSWVRPVVVYGGADMAHQSRELNNGCDVLVGTPGRLLDMIERGKISLSAIRYLVLDEADRMLDMGFEPDIRKLVKEMPAKEARNTLMFSATFPKEIQMLARDFLKDYLFLSVGRVGSTSENIQQRIEYVEPHEKRDLLVDILNAEKDSGRILVFVEKKRDADILEEYLYRENFQATSIHGDRTQDEREAALRKFRRGETPILVATAVASRGLDIPNVNRVIIYDFPKDIDEYVHRIGRTGRAGNVGTSIAFFTSEDMSMAKALYGILQEAKQTLPQWLQSSVHRQSAPANRRGGRGGHRDYRSNVSTKSSSTSGTVWRDSADVRIQIPAPSAWDEEAIESANVKDWY